jgi:hypothetical protein
MILHKSTLFILTLLPLYLLALNPYLGPSIYDDVIYRIGAESLVAGQGYTYDGKVIADWPPVFSILLATPIFLGFTSLWISKIVVLIFVGLSLFMVAKVFEIEDRENKVATYLLFAFSPVSFLCGSRLLSEWIFIFFVFLFLFALYQVNTKTRAWWGFWTWIAALSLALACLTRYAGLFLIIPLGSTLIIKRNRTPHRWLSTLMIGTVGLLIFFLAWIFPVRVLSSDSLELRYYRSFEQLVNIDLKSSLRDFSHFMLNLMPAGEQKIHPAYMILALGFLALVFIGFYQRIKRKGWMYTDYWTLAVVFVCLILSSKYPRYLLPAAPNLFSYALLGFEKIGGKKILPMALAIWIALFVFLDIHLLVYGNRKTYNGLNVWVSPSPREFYRGYWHDLFEVSKVINSSRLPGSIGLLSEDLEGEKYLYYFTRRKIVKKDLLTEQPSFLLYEKNSPISNLEGYTFQYQNASFVLLKRTIIL